MEYAIVCLILLVDFGIPIWQKDFNSNNEQRFYFLWANPVKCTLIVNQAPKPYEKLN